MKNMSNIAKFFVVCAVIFTLGLVLTIGGCAAGGMTEVREAVNNGGWSISGRPAETGITEGEYEFSSVEVKGDSDIVIAGSKYYKDVLAENELSGIEAKAGKVVVIYDKDGRIPEIKTEEGRLIIDTEADLDPHFNDSFFEPTVIVLCPDAELESLKADSPACDLDVKGVSFRAADIDMDAGDIDMKDIISGGISIKSDAGDVEIAGVLKGLTEVKADAGSVEIDVFNGIKSYTMDLRADAGDIKVGEDESFASNYEQKGGDDTIRVIANAGDIEIGNL